MQNSYKSNGKLLLTAEYFVLDGAKALALPTQLGQSIEWSSQNENMLVWESYLSTGERWFSAIFNTEGKIISCTDYEVAAWLEKILHQCLLLNPELNLGYTTLRFSLDFDREWGLGSSSTLLSNIAIWAQVDPFILSASSFGGSGYDIACARANGPIIYQITDTIPHSNPSEFNPVFKEQLFFIPLNKKQNSREGIATYRSINTNKHQLIEALNTITSSIEKTTELSEFETLISHHEDIISSALEMPKIKNTYFSDYKGSVKSLGAWGGDFILVTYREGMHSYFKDKGLHTLFSYSDLILYNR